MAIWYFFAGVALASLLLTWVLRRYALARSLMDIPNGRSSHTVPTPRGGGVAIVLSFVLTLPFLALAVEMPLPVVWALTGAGGLIAIVGFLDDHGHIAARWRLLAHFLAAAWALLWLGGLPTIKIFGADISLGWLGHALAAFYLVWLQIGRASCRERV